MLERIIKVLDHDPDLGEGLDPQRLARAHFMARAVTIEVAPGPWKVRVWPEDVRRGIGLLVLDGAVLRHVALDGRVGGELLMRGDLLRPWQHEDAIASIARSSSARVLQRTRMAVLDLRFAQRIAAFPEIQGQFVARALRRSRYLAVNMAIVHQPKVQTRLLMLLWHLADRCGTVQAGGVFVPTSLTHALLAARRPTVSAAIGALTRAGAIAEEHEGWLLRGSPPGDLDAVDAPVQVALRDVTSGPLPLARTS